jgi:hypothetical protein
MFDDLSHDERDAILKIGKNSKSSKGKESGIDASRTDHQVSPSPTEDKKSEVSTR